MKKVYVILPDKPPYSLCAKSFAKGFKNSGYFVEKEYSSKLENNKVLNFNPDFVMCFNFSELNEGFLEKIYQNNSDCIFIFDFLTALNPSFDKKNIKKLTDFEAKKIILTADKANLDIIPNCQYLSNGIQYRKYKSFYQGYSDGITILSNPDNINVLKTITDLISEFGKISIYADEIDYVNSLENELWKEINDPKIKELFKQSYKKDIFDEKTRAEVLSTSFITVIPATRMQNGVDYRILEGAASSSFLICEENNEIKRLFDIGREIETYKTNSELTDKIKFYLKNPSIARSIADNARLAAVNNHSVFDRVKKIFSIIKKEYNGRLKWQKYL